MLATVSINGREAFADTNAKEESSNQSESSTKT
jgi:hypothetical protein